MIVASVGRSGSTWLAKCLLHLGIPTEHYCRINPYREDDAPPYTAGVKTIKVTTEPLLDLPTDRVVVHLTRHPRAVLQSLVGSLQWPVDAAIRYILLGNLFIERQADIFVRAEDRLSTLVTLTEAFWPSVPRAAVDFEAALGEVGDDVNTLPKFNVGGFEDSPLLDLLKAEADRYGYEWSDWQ